ncbi:MAG TPA: DUF72 domain-containing protein [Chthoniobacterales bacterium]|nr:DUF72 domain-containing protein [Chthoniobacterales bacterium]
MNLKDQQKIRIGACAWNFPEWHGSFYPADLPESEWLEFYARYFPAVEIDSTFYGAPDENAVRRWIEQTPASFRFSCKLPREITHVCQLRDCTSELNAFLRRIEPLEAKLHVILVQLPPSFTPKEGRQALRKFLIQLPKGFRFAIEFRNPGWHRPQIIRLLEHHRICWVWADTSPLNERNLAPFEFLPLTTDFLYLRLLGDYATKYDGDGKFVHRYDKLLWMREAALESWALKIERHLSEVRNVWAFVSNHFEGFAPETAKRLAQRLGYELSLAPQREKETGLQQRSQMDLFENTRPAAEDKV